MIPTVDSLGVSGLTCGLGAVIFLDFCQYPPLTKERGVAGSVSLEAISRCVIASAGSLTVMWIVYSKRIETGLEGAVAPLY